MLQLKTLFARKILSRLKVVSQQTDDAQRQCGPRADHPRNGALEASLLGAYKSWRDLMMIPPT